MGASNEHRHFRDENLDAVNRKTWRLPGIVRLYTELDGWSDPGEQAALAAVAAEVRSCPVLDIGVGAGRTTGLLQSISRDYVGIDYTPEMVEACRTRYPRSRIFQMDARNLGTFDSDQFALVVFSFNGIDAVDLAGRLRILDEVHRVLRPGGLFVFSSHNRDGPGLGEAPGLHLQFSWNPLKLGWRALRTIGALPRSMLNHQRHRALNEAHDEWSIMNCAAHDFGIVVMYTTLAEQKRQLRESGFSPERVLDNVRGEAVADGADTRGVWWFHHIARKAA
jgi:SAM-dependent methyltransferase